MNLVLLVLWNVAVFIIYGTDKKRAVNGRWRVSESMLITCAFCMGAVGSLLGMIVFRHKVRKFRFFLTVMIALAFNIVLFLKV